MSIKIAPDVPRWVANAIEDKAERMGVRGFKVVVGNSWSVGAHNTLSVPRKLGGFPFYFNSLGYAHSICHELSHIRNWDHITSLFFMFRNWPLGMPIATIFGAIFRNVFLNWYRNRFPESSIESLNKLDMGLFSGTCFLAFCDLLMLLTFFYYPPFCQYEQKNEARADAEALDYLSTREKVDSLIGYLGHAIEVEKWFKEDGWKTKNIYKRYFFDHPAPEDRVQKIKEHLQQQFFLIRIYAFLLLYLSPRYWIYRLHLAFVK